MSFFLYVGFIVQAWTPGTLHDDGGVKAGKTKVVANRVTMTY